nr:TonB-dependent receptor [Tenacibaculum sp.]
ILDPRVKLGDIDETNAGAYVNTEFKYKKWIFNPGLRVDFFKFLYKDKLLEGGVYRTDDVSEFTISPKLNILYNPTDNLQLFLKSGKGFHSNDTRSNVLKPAVGSKITKILPSAYGADLGFIWKPAPKLMFTTALWYLYLDEELVYVGDAGVQEASTETHRKGIDFSAVYNPTTWLNLNLDATFTDPKAKTEDGSGYEEVALAPTFTLQAGATVNHPSGFFGGVKVLHLGDRPAGDDITAIGYTVTSLNLGYTWNSLTFGFQARNLFDVKWRETQFATESRPIKGGEPILGRHLTPGLPFNYKFTLTYRF